MTSLQKDILALREKKALVQMGGGEAAIEKQEAMGKLTARNRILALLDENSFQEYDLFVEHEARGFRHGKKSFTRRRSNYRNRNYLWRSCMYLCSRFYRSRWISRFDARS